MFRLLINIIAFPLKLFIFFFGWGKAGHFSNRKYFRRAKIIEKTAEKVGTSIQITGVERHDPFEIYYFTVLNKKFNKAKIKKMIAKQLEISEGKIFFRKNKCEDNILELFFTEN
jgi:hypothetical protein